MTLYRRLHFIINVIFFIPFPVYIGIEYFETLNLYSISQVLEKKEITGLKSNVSLLLKTGVIIVTYFSVYNVYNKSIIQYSFFILRGCHYPKGCFRIII